MKLQSLAVSVLALVGLSACDLAGPLQDLKTSPPASSRFGQSLATSYLAFAQEEADDYDWFNSRHFALKGLAAARGETVLPENPADWDVDNGPSQGDLAALRARLIVALDAGGRDRAPETAASAQTGYDCWLEEMAEGWETAEIEACRKQFMTSLESLEGTPGRAEQDRYQVFFDFAAYQLDPIARQIIAEAAKAIAAAKSTNVVVIGHADRAGAADFNMALSSRRAEQVKQALVSMGVPADRIHAVAQGEGDPLVATADGVREPQNRRVVVRF
jgi:OOP family OmpA-OmpF porin